MKPWKPRRPLPIGARFAFHLFHSSCNLVAVSLWLSLCLWCYLKARALPTRILRKAPKHQMSSHEGVHMANHLYTWSKARDKAPMSSFLSHEAPSAFAQLPFSEKKMLPLALVELVLLKVVLLDVMLVDVVVLDVTSKGKHSGVCGKGWNEKGPSCLSSSKPHETNSTHCSSIFVPYFLNYSVSSCIFIVPVYFPIFPNAKVSAVVVVVVLLVTELLVELELVNVELLLVTSYFGAHRTGKTEWFL